jgi:outer membrane immunogenic protein
MKGLLLASVSVLALTYGAVAADLPARPAPMPMKAVAPAPAWTWTGFYLGLNGGGVWHRAAFAGVDQVPNVDFSTIKVASPTFGVQAGFNWQVQQLVLGVEADWNYTNAGGSSGFQVFPGNNFFTSTLSWLATVRGRIGLAWSSSMLYATGGFAAGRVSNQVPVQFGGFPNDDKIKTGWTAGGGIEHMFTQNWTAKAEALYVDLGRSTATGFFGAGYIGNFNNTAVIGRIGVNYKW